MSRTDDAAAIREVTARYNQVIDGGAAERIGEVFQPDGYLAVEGKTLQQGLDGLAALATNSKGHFVHTTTDAIIEIEGDRATQRCTLVLFAIAPDGTSSFSRVGYYDDVLVRTADGWRFISRDVSFA